MCIIGAGKMSRLLVKHLASKGLQRLTLLNRSTPRCAELQAEFPEVTFDVHLMPDLMQCVADCDTIFAASGSEDILVRASDLEGVFHSTSLSAGVVLCSLLSEDPLWCCAMRMRPACLLSGIHCSVLHAHAGCMRTVRVKQ